MLIETFLFRLPSGDLTGVHVSRAHASIHLPGAVALEETLETLELWTHAEVVADRKKRGAPTVAS